MSRQLFRLLSSVPRALHSPTFYLQPIRLMSSHRKRGFTDWRKVKKAKRDNADAEKPVLSSLDSYNAGTNPVPPPLNTQVITADAGLDAVTPYRTFPYLKQLRKKRQDVSKAFRRIHREVVDSYNRFNKERRNRIEAGTMPGPYAPQKPSLPYAVTRGSALPCPLGPVFESPTLEGYRNKNEFTLGSGLDGAPTAGFQCGRYADGETRIGSPAGCLSAPLCAQDVAELVTRFMREDPVGSQLGCWDKLRHDGFYRLVTVRNSGALGQMMVSLQVNPDAASPELYAQWKAALREYMVRNTYAGDLSRDRAQALGVPLTEAVDPAAHVAPTAEGLAFAERTGQSLASLLVQEYSGISNAAPDTSNIETLFGMGSIYDVISGKTFRVNLNSFFQVNVKGAELLYAKAAQWALAPPHDFAMPTEALLDTYAAVAPNYAERLQELTREFAAYRQAEENAKAAEEGREPVTLPDREVDFDSHQMFAPRTHGYPVVPLSDTPDPAHADKTLLLDICCGTGTIGLIMSDNVQRVVGLELVPAAIEDAKANAELNSVTKASFVCGKAESTLGKVIHEHRDQMDFAVGIVDPPRSGLHNDVLTALRASSLKRIVYVSCNATTLADNVARLAGPTTAKYKGAPFIPVVGVAVDMFPHTPHCEVVMMLERAPEGTVFPEPEPEVKAEKAQKTEDATEEVKSEAAVEEATAETVVAEEGNEK